MSGLVKALTLACRLFVAGLFLFAAYDKVWDPAAFAQDMGNYNLMPLWALNTASVLMAWLELVAGLCLLAGFWTRAAAAWLAALLVVFTGLMIYAGLTGAGYDCGCFPGQAGHQAGFGGALLDLCFLLPALWLLWRPRTWLSVDNWLLRHDWPVP